jgi:hypothetical protein
VWYVKTESMPRRASASIVERLRPRLPPVTSAIGELPA